MGTISRMFVYSGFCPLDNDDTAIEIEYTSLQLPNVDKKMKRFTKAQNCCCYLRKGKCAKKEDCPIFLEAESTRYEDFSNINY